MNLAPFDLAFVEEAQPARQQRHDRRRLVHGRREGRGGPWLVVVLEEAHRAILKARVGHQVLAHRRGALGHQAIVEALVVGLVEAGLLQRPLHVPVDLRHEHELWVAALDGGDGLRPERIVLGRRPVGRPGAVAPGLLDDLRLQQHRHVAPDAVAAIGDGPELGDARFAKAGVAVVELKGVWPAVEVGIAAVGEDHRLPAALHARVVLRLPRDIVRAALDVVLGVLGHPG